MIHFQIILKISIYVYDLTSGFVAPEDEACVYKHIGCF